MPWVEWNQAFAPIYRQSQKEAPEKIVLVVLTLLFVVAFIAPWIFRKLGRSTFYILAAVPAGGFIWLLATFDRFTGSNQSVLSGGPNAPPSVNIPWIPELRLELAFRMDTLSAVLAILILGVGALVLFYCARYFKADDPNIGPFGAQLLAFAGAMFGLVITDDLLMLYVFWELTTVLSYLLIGYARHRLAARRSALQALIVTTFGGLTMLVGLIMVGQTAGTYRISEIMAAAPELIQHGMLIDVAILLILVGAISKSALVPFHFWLPAAMAAPTPVSAYLHAAAMVKAGIYLVARFAPGFSDTRYWEGTVMVLGLATMLVGGWLALKQFDLKLILAYGTVSQLGFLTMVVGLGSRDGALAGLGLLLAHGFFKATLFLVVGIIDHQSGTRDIRQLSGIYRAAPVLFTVSLIGAASMAGVPPLLGFVAKESVYETFVHHASEGGWTGPVLLAGVVVGSMLTFAYSARFVWGGFAYKPNVKKTPFKRIPGAFIAAPMLLTAATVVYGLWPSPLDSIIAPYVSLFPSDGEPDGHLALWHGLTPALGLTVLTLAVGTLLFLFRAGVTAFQDRLSGGLTGERAYRGIIGVLDEVAVWVTGRTQRGSLIYYLVVILARQLDRFRLSRATDRGTGHHCGGHPRHPGQQTVHGRADGVRGRLRHRADLCAAGRTGPGIDPDARRNHRAGRDCAGTALPPGAPLAAEPQQFQMAAGCDRCGVRPGHDGHRHDVHGCPHAAAGLVGIPAAGVRRRWRSQRCQRHLGGYPCLGHLR
jgi:multicomponent Na+:H+ antiporter subunit A